MKFTDTQFVEAIELIQAADAGKSKKDKRRAARTAIRVPVAIKLGLDPKTEWLGARLMDISARGAKLETAAAMEVNSSFLLRLPTKDPKKGGVPLICRVAHCVKLKHSYSIGAEFIGRLTAGQSAGQNAEDLDKIKKSILD
jgi:hypothetical protein